MRIPATAGRPPCHRALLAGLCAAVLHACGTATGPLHVPRDGYRWPATDRAYWPTSGWITGSPVDHGIDPALLRRAERFARDDPLARALLVVKDGYLVCERYYGDGGPGKSTNLWSVTKSVTSALVGIALDDGLIGSTDQRMADLMPGYPAFGDITLRHVLTQTTGLRWTEEGPSWARWVLSPDWVQAALDRGSDAAPGARFLYSSANSHFLTALIARRTAQSPGRFAKSRLFDPLGIPFEPLVAPAACRSWDDYIPPVPQSWRQDPKGIETAGFGLCLTARDMAKLGFLYLNRGRWEGRRIVSEAWVRESTRDHVTNVHGRYSYGYQWWVATVAGRPAFLASGFGGQIIGVVPSLDLVVVLKYEAGKPVHAEPGTPHDDMHLFALVVESVA